MRIDPAATMSNWAREHWVNGPSTGQAHGIADVRCVFGERALDVRRARLSLRRSRHDT